MIKFIDGPAHGIASESRRLVRFLRVAMERKADDAGTFIVLDQEDMKPVRTAAVYAYEQVLVPKARKDTYYIYLVAQPKDEILRDNEQWRKWCYYQSNGPATLFVDVVRQMRRAQREYFRSRTEHALKISKELEKRVDDMLADHGQKELFQ